MSCRPGGGVAGHAADYTLSYRNNLLAGKVTVKKKCKKGTYRIKVKVTAAGNANYRPVSKTVTFKVKVA